jgi:hypothetical protein
MRCLPRRALEICAVAVTTAALLCACVPVEYVRPGAALQSRADRPVVVGRIRCVHQNREWFPWDPTVADFLLKSARPRHFWLRSLDSNTITPELHPDPDGSLAIRMPAGDYALIGTDEDISDVDSTTRFEIVALLRVPRRGPLVYAGDLILVENYPEGWSAGNRWLGEPELRHVSLAEETTALEAKYGPLPGPPVASYWCVGSELPARNDFDGLQRARALLSGGCRQ